MVITTLTSEHGLRLAGEVDFSNRHELETALDSWADHDTDLHLDLSELDFIDTGSTRLLVAAAARLSPGRRLFLHHPPRHLQRILALLWPDAPGIELRLP